LIYKSCRPSSLAPPQQPILSHLFPPSLSFWWSRNPLVLVLVIQLELGHSPPLYHLLSFFYTLFERRYAVQVLRFPRYLLHRFGSYCFANSRSNCICYTRCSPRVNRGWDPRTYGD